MKKLLPTTLFMAFSFFSMAQKIDSAAMSKLSPVQRMEVDTLLVQAKAAHSSALATLFGGSALSIAGLIILGVQTADDDWFDGEEPDYTAGTIMFFVGGGIALLSIPQFRKSKALTRKANVIVFGQPNVSLAPGIKLPRTASAGIGIVIPLGK